MKSTLVLVLGLIFGTIILGAATLHSQIVVLSIPLIVYLFAGIVQRPENIELKINRVLTPEQAPQGTPITVKLTVTNCGPAIDELAVQDILPGGIKQVGGRSSQVSFLESQGKIELEYTVEAHRGEYVTYTVLVSARDSFNLFEQPLLYRTQTRLIAHPRYPKLNRIKIRPPQTRGFAGPIAARQGGTGIDFWGVREYQSGDPQRQINWRLTARSYHELYTNIFEQERVADVGLILDTRQRTNVVTVHGSLFEYSIRATAALVENFLNDGNRVSLLLYGTGIGRVFPGYGSIQRDRILKILSGANPGLNYALENLAALPTRMFPAQSQIVLVSPLAPEDIPVIVRIRAHGYAVMVISPDPISYEAALYQDFTSPAYRLAYTERDFMLRQIRRNGVQVVNWRVDQPLEVAVRYALAHQPAIFHVSRINL